MFSVGLKPVIPAIKQLETYALGSVASWSAHLKLGSFHFKNLISVCTINLSI